MIKPLFIVFGGIVFFLIMFLIWLDHPLPIYSGTKQLPVEEKVEVYTDSYGVPHVFALNEKDLFFTAGYIAARDRLFQLSMVSLAVKGELSSVLGEDYIKTDIYLRTWKIHHTANVLVKNMNPKNKKIFDSFCKGINYRIDETLNDLPLEFKILGFKPDYWNSVIVAGYTRMMAHEMQGSWKPEIIFGAVYEYFGKEKLLDLIPKGNFNDQTIATVDFENKSILFDEIIKQERFLRNILGDYSADLGSNNWVVSGKRTNSGKPFLANDPHLAFTQPPRWYEIHLNGGRFNVSGVCIAGIPMPVIGQNENTAWGFTNSMVDDLDFFIEEINPENENQYKHDGKWKNIKKIKEEIKILNAKDTVVYVRSTHHGPIISDIHPMLKNKNVAMSFAWTGHWVTKEMDAWVKLTTMKNWDDFTNAVKDFGVPGQNIVYADIEGNIGWRPAVFIPIRREGFSMLPRPGNNSFYDWKGKVPFNEMPFLYNPKKGFISTANNKIIGDEFPFYISGLWADQSRVKRLNDYLEGGNDFVSLDMKELQLDYTSEFSKTILKFLKKYDIKIEDPGHRDIIDIMLRWDGVESPESIGALLFHVFINRLNINIYKDEFDILGDEYLDGYFDLKYIKDRKLREIMKNGDSMWIDDIRTKGKIEKLDELIKISYLGMIKYVKNQYGNNKSNWKWGLAHKLTHKHLLSNSKILEYLFSLNIGPFNSGGSSWTPNAGGYSDINPFEQTSGASMRRIVDFSNLNNTQIILPTGQSGLYNSPHYNDQAKLYHKGDYRTTEFYKDSMKNKDYRILYITPK